MSYGKTFNNLGKFWTKEEKDILIREYPKNGFRGVQKYLPDKTHASIRTKAKRLGYTRPDHDRGKGYNPDVFKQLTDTEAAYIAGFFDGEGCIHITKKHQLHITVSNTDFAVVDYLGSILGGTVKIRWRNSVKQREIKRWHIVGVKATVFLQRILPFLRVKKEEAVLAIEFQSKIHFRNSKITDAEFQEREYFRNKISELKGRIK